jgi:predicted nucleotidyltransferase
LKNYPEAIKKYIASVKNDKNIIGIVVCGSYVRNELDNNSDIDIHLILRPDCDFRERGNTWIDNVEIEYFKNPPKQIRSYFEKETKSPHTADMLANGKVLLKKSPIIDDLVLEAKEILNKKPRELTPLEIEISKYHLDDLRKDLEDCLERENGVDFSLVKNKIIEECIDLLFWLKRIRRGKRKRLFEQIKDIDSYFGGLLAKALQEKNLRIENIKTLIEYTETLLGGKRPLEWVLKSSLDM